MWEARGDVADTRRTATMRAPGPSNDVIGVGEQGAHWGLDVAVPQHLSAAGPANRSPDDPTHHQGPWQEQVHDQVAAGEQHRAGLRVLILGDPAGPAAQYL